MRKRYLKVLDYDAIPDLFTNILVVDEALEHRVHEISQYGEERVRQDAENQ